VRKYYDEPYYAVAINKSGVSRSIYDLSIGDLVMILGEDAEDEKTLALILEDEFESWTKEDSTYWGKREDFEPIQLLTDA